MTNKLVPKTLGPELVRLAMEKENKKKSELVLSQVTFILERIQFLKPMQTRISKQLELCANQLDAIEQGKFKIDPHTAQITYNNPDLNINWDETARW